MNTADTRVRRINFRNKPAPPPRQSALASAPPVERFAYRVSEAAEALGISEPSMQRWVKHGLIPSVKILGIRLVLKKHLIDLDHVIERQQTS